MDKPTLKNIVKHDGDCSCYVIGSVICDCGALREEMRKDYFCTDKDDLWEIWMKQVNAIEKTCEKTGLVFLWK